MSGDAGVLEPRAGTAARAEAVRRPRRYLVYIAGIGTRLFLPMVQELVRRLDAHAERVAFVIGDRPSYRWALRQPRDPRIELIYQHERLDPFRHPARLDLKKLAGWEERYGVPNLRRYILVHRMIDRLSEERKLAYVQTYLEYFDELARRERPDVLITAAPDSMLFLMAQQVMKQHGALLLLLGPGRFRGRFFIVDNELEQIPGLEEAYAALKSRALTPEEQAGARALRDTYRARRIRPRYYGIGPRLRTLPSPRRFLQLVNERVIEEDRYFERGVGAWVKQSLVTRWRTPWQRRDLRRCATAALRDEPFFYYPLHYEPESAIDVFSTEYRDQLRVIELAAASLPAGHALYVKENPNMAIGTRPMGYYRRLAGMPGVRLLPTHTDSYDIIARCRGVMTLAGTTGFEALCCGKPVLMFGHAFYEVFREGIRRPSGRDGVAAALQQMSASPRVDDDLLERFLAAVLARTQLAELEQSGPEVEQAENIRALADCVINELAFRLGRNGAR
ncbi:MAG: hypothetical protein HYY91_00560 [Candidatus Omnitrophica bacterium]|nr:hypothetical protein [Candidatus Omnitrophota bacterium]